MYTSEIIDEKVVLSRQDFLDHFTFMSNNFHETSPLAFNGNILDLMNDWRIKFLFLISASKLKQMRN